MNAERLHAIALALRDDLASTQVPTLINQLATSLAQFVQEPANPSAQQQVSSTREQLIRVLRESRVNEFPDSWVQTLDELGASDVLGMTLLHRLEETFGRNEITPSTAANEVAAINAAIQALTQQVDQLVAALEAFHIGTEELLPGEFEIGFLIPREAVDNELEQLGKEFTEIDKKILGPFLELTGSNRPDVEVRTISSSGFQLFIAAYSDLALTMSRVLESLLSSYQRVRDMRKTVDDLEKSDTPETAYAGLIAHANERMDLDIQALAEELIRDVSAQLPQGREHELKIDITHSLRRMAKRIDEGYSIEVRAFSPATEGDDPTDAEASSDEIEAARVIASRQKDIGRMNLTGHPILALPEADGSATGDEPEAA